MDKCVATILPRKSIFLNPHGDFFGDVGVANSQFPPRPWMDVAYSAFLKQVGIFYREKNRWEHCKLAQSWWFVFQTVQTFWCSIFFWKRYLLSWYLEECLVHVHDRQQYRRLAFTGHVSCWVSIATRLAHILFLEGDVGRGWRLEGWDHWSLINLLRLRAGQVRGSSSPTTVYISFSFVSDVRLVDSGQFFHHHRVLQWPRAKVSSFASQGDLFHWSSQLDIPPGSDREAQIQSTWRGIP